MNKTKIEWCDYTWNPITGCLQGCSYCYARKIYHRFHRSFKPTFHEDRLNEIYKLKKHSLIFVCSVSDFWGKGVKPIWRAEVLNQIMGYPEHTFLILTKHPENILDNEPKPENLWIGVSVTGDSDRRRISILEMKKNQDSEWRSPLFISYEPMLEYLNLFDEQMFVCMVDWIILGALTGTGSKKYLPQKEWIQEAIDWKNMTGRPIFMKNSLKEISMMTSYGELIQEFPPSIGGTKMIQDPYIRK